VREQLSLLPGYLGAHVRLVVIALFACFCIAVPLGVAATRSRRLERIAVGIASVIQTIPALALLAVMVPVLAALGMPAIGFTPALLGLSLYSALPILLATITGIREVSPALIEAARAVGMTDRQRLGLVELPLAMPYIVAGTRTAAVWSVGMATLSTPIGAPSLGNFIFGGLQTGNHAATLVGCLAAAALALTLDGLVLLVERGLRQRSRRALRAGVAGLLALAAFTLLSSLGHGRAEAYARPLRIGAKSFTENLVLAELLATRAEAAGRRAEVVPSLGSSVIFDALASGDLDAYVDYSGTVYTTVLGRKGPVSDRARLLGEVRDELSRRHGVGVAAALGFENTYCLAVRELDAKKRGWSQLSDLARNANELALGTDYEFLSREEWSSLRRVYGFSFREQRSMDPTLMYQAMREKTVDVISAFSTDGRIEGYGLRVLTDDRHVIPPYDAIVLVRSGLETNVLRSFTALEGRIDAPTMRELNRRVDADGRTPRRVARDFAATLR
jgi:osmoprotectant transport system permease protein